MKYIQYKEYNLATNSTAYALFQEWKKCTNQREAAMAKAKLDGHLNQVDRNYKELTK